MDRIDWLGFERSVHEGAMTNLAANGLPQHACAEKPTAGGISRAVLRNSNRLEEARAGAKRDQSLSPRMNDSASEDDPDDVEAMWDLLEAKLVEANAECYLELRRQHKCQANAIADLNLLIAPLKSENVQLSRNLKWVYNQNQALMCAIREFFGDPARSDWIKENHEDKDLCKFFQRLATWHRIMGKEVNPALNFYRTIWAYERDDEKGAGERCTDEPAANDNKDSSEQTGANNESENGREGYPPVLERTTANLYDVCRERIKSAKLTEEIAQLRRDCATLREANAALDQEMQGMLARHSQTNSLLQQHHETLEDHFSPSGTAEATPRLDLSSRRPKASITLRELVAIDAKWNRLLQDPDQLFSAEDVIDETYEEYLHQVLYLMQLHGCSFKKAITLATANLDDSPSMEPSCDPRTAPDFHVLTGVADDGAATDFNEPLMAPRGEHQSVSLRSAGTVPMPEKSETLPCGSEDGEPWWPRSDDDETERSGLLANQNASPLPIVHLLKPSPREAADGYPLSSDSREIPAMREKELASPLPNTSLLELLSSAPASGETSAARNDMSSETSPGRATDLVTNLSIPDIQKIPQGRPEVFLSGESSFREYLPACVDDAGRPDMLPTGETILIDSAPEDCLLTGAEDESNHTVIANVTETTLPMNGQIEPVPSDLVHGAPSPDRDKGMEVDSTERVQTKAEQPELVSRAQILEDLQDLTTKLQGEMESQNVLMNMSS